MTSLVNPKSIASTFTDQDLPFPGLCSFGVTCNIHTTYIHRCVPTAQS